MMNEILKERNLIDRSEMAKVIDYLNDRGVYLFKKEIKEELLR